MLTSHPESTPGWSHRQPQAASPRARSRTGAAPWRPLDQLDAAHDLVGLGIQKLIALKLHRPVVVVELGLTVAELTIPLAALARLETVLVADLHQDAVLGKLLQNSLHVRTKLAVVCAQVLDEKIGEVLLLGANADVGPTLRA